MCGGELGDLGSLHTSSWNEVPLSSDGKTHRLRLTQYHPSGRPLMGRGWEGKGWGGFGVTAKATLRARALTSLGGLKSPRQHQWKKLHLAIGL